MSETEKMTLVEASRKFAVNANQQVWLYLEMSTRTPAQDEEMLLAAYASLYHWNQVGTIVNTQRGYWLLAHVYAVLSQPNPSRRYAEICHEITRQYPDDMKDFDMAYAFEALARAHAMQGDQKTASEFYGKAQQAGMIIADEEDRKIFFGDFTGGNWFGLI